uniref:Putative LysR family transcriptional regulator n=1 Tax=Paenibacillus sp. NyZ101 TaxID=980079 RepID=H6TG63_9BACL|nr:putative LysR family transcriptional regulator [Paenibacillus sp. NyZ101]
MDSEKLETFLCIAQEKSFSKASKLLYVNQPTLSARIQSLEKELGVELFERLGKGKGIKLSHYGNLYLPFAQQILKLMKESKELLDKEKGIQHTNLRIGASSRIGNYILPGILSEFHFEFPNIEMTMVSGSALEIAQMVVDGDIDVAFVNQLVHFDALENIQLMWDDILLFFSHKRMGHFSDPQPIELMAGETLILFDNKRNINKQSSYWQLIDRYFADQNLIFRNVINIDQLEAIKSLVKQNAGVSFLPKSMISHELKRSEVGAVMIDPPMPKLGIQFIYHKQRHRPIIDSLKQIAQRCLT